MPRQLPSSVNSRMTDRFTVHSEFENPTYGGDDGVEVMPARMDLIFVLLFVDEHRPRDVERVAVGAPVLPRARVSLTSVVALSR